MESLYESEIYTDTKELPKEYLILKLRMYFNKELLENKIITYDIYNRMQNLLTKKMDKIIMKYRK